MQVYGAKQASCQFIAFTFDRSKNAKLNLITLVIKYLYFI